MTDEARIIALVLNPDGTTTVQCDESVTHLELLGASALLERYASDIIHDYEEEE